MIKVGTKLGRYEIRSKIGAGGMGEVYLARDPKIGRDVAIKVLPAPVAGERERLERFEQEAQAAGSLNHPNILSVFDVEAHDGAPYIVSEFLEGETLRERLEDGAIPPRVAVEYAVQIANGLTAAHERGIVHRDLKPENIFITKDERVKILDFGLAKLTEVDRFDGVAADAPTRKIRTDPGTVMGTVGYMSPEQVRGARVDHRSDLFAFGTVLYEMLIGEPPFRGETGVETLNAILKEDPPEFAEASGRSIPQPLESVVRHCLEKKPERRFQSANDIAFALATLPAGSGSAPTVIGAPAVKREFHRERLPWIVGCALLAAVAAWFAYGHFSRQGAPSRSVKLAFQPPPIASNAGGLAISPDGSRIVFGATNAEGKRVLWVRALDSLDAEPLPGTDGAASAFWSPDNRHVGYFAAGKLYKIDTAGGRAQVLCDSPENRGGAWNRDDVILFAGAEGLYRVSANGGRPALATKIDPKEEAHRWPYFLPDGKHFVFLGDAPRAEDHNIRVGSLGSEETKPLFPAISRVAYSAGYLLFVRQGALFAQKFDAAGMKLEKEPVAVADPIADIGPNHEFDFSVSNNGELVYQAGSRASHLVWFDRAGKQVESFAEQANYGTLSGSPDGRRAVVTVLDANGRNGDLWLVDFERRTKSRISFGPQGEFSPVLSPDGKRIVFGSNRDEGGWSNLYQKNIADAGEEAVLVEAGAEKHASSWSPDGRLVLFDRGSPQGAFGIWVVALTGDRTPRPYLQTTDFSQYDGQISPDGKYVAYTSEESGRPEIYVQTFPSPSQKWQISNSGGRTPRWRADGRELFYITPDGKIMSVEAKTSGGFESGIPRELFQTNMVTLGGGYGYSGTADGRRFLVNTRAGSPGGPSLVVVLDWTADLERQVSK